MELEDDNIDDELVLFKKPLLNPKEEDADFAVDFVFGLVLVFSEDGWISLRGDDMM